MLNLSINLKDKFPLTDKVRLECLLKELERHAYPMNGEATQTQEPPQKLNPQLTIDKKYITPDHIRISLHHSPSNKVSYVCFHGNDTVAVDLLKELFFYSLSNNFSFRQLLHKNT